MTTTDANPHLPSKRTHWLWWAFAILFGTFTVLVILWVYRSYSDEQYLASVFAELDRTDPGWRWDEIDAARRKVPDEENSALVALNALGLMPGSFNSSQFYEKYHAEGYEDLTVHPAAQLDEARTAMLRAEMAPATRAVEEARRLIDFPYGRFALRMPQNPLTISLSHIQNTRQLANLLLYDAQLRVQDGDADGALVSAHAMVNLSRSIGDEPFLVSALVRIAERSLALHTVERILAQGEPTEPGLARLQAALVQDEADPFLPNCFRGERAIGDLFCQGLQSGEITWKQMRGLTGPVSAADKTGWGWLDDTIAWWNSESFTSTAKGRAALLEFHSQMIAIAKEPMHLQEAHGRELEMTLPRQPMLVRLLAPATSKVLQAYRRSQAEMRCAIVALAAERFRLANRRWPESLAEFSPTLLARVPLDPFDGQPLRYRKTDEGLLIYSVGPDGKDDGGKIDRTKGGTSPGLDLGFWLFDVPKRRQPPVPKKDDAQASEESKPQ